MTIVVTRAQWGADDPTGQVPALTPTFGTTIHYEGGSGLNLTDHARCASTVRGIQRYHIEVRGWIDIAYSQVCCPHRYLFEGRGLHKRSAANGTNEGNDAAYAICALIDTDDPITDGLLDALAYGVHQNRAAGAPRGVNGHRDWKATACPRDDLYGQIGEIRRRADALLHPPADAPPVGSPTPGNPEAAVRVPIRVTINNSRGYTDVPYDLLRTVGPPSFFGGDPSNGWDPPPCLEPPYKVGIAPGKTRIVVTRSSVVSGYLDGEIWVTD